MARVTSCDIRAPRLVGGQNAVASAWRKALEFLANRKDCLVQAALRDGSLARLRRKQLMDAQVDLLVFGKHLKFSVSRFAALTGAHPVAPVNPDGGVMRLAGA